jgi:hypothetical protein
VEYPVAPHLTICPPACLPSIKTVLFSVA